MSKDETIYSLRLLLDNEECIIEILHKAFKNDVSDEATSIILEACSSHPNRPDIQKILFHIIDDILYGIHNHTLIFEAIAAAGSLVEPWRSRTQESVKYRLLDHLRCSLYTDEELNAAKAFLA